MILNSIYAFIATLGFAGIFNIRGKKFFYASLCGSLSWTVYLIFLHLNYSNVLSFFAASLAIGIYSEILARLLKTPVTTFVICGLIPLVPGGGMYYTMQKCIEGDVNGALNMGINTLSIAGSIALGIVIISSITKIIFKFKEKLFIKI
ncbi:threonine/serine exporter [Clostridium niameyense]|uniref:Threonine/serine exporter n=1 Tax=Clostridium niameyense TaxID=1622073 RepID=A0A6M0R6Y8_9CLOT|nr:threonine/serine exporter family protein [Clostridium niameyense]NEZ45951.1 threonine/serine exporter [Clostridium niameyense]